MPDKLNLSNVALKGTGGVFFNNDKPMLPLNFECPFGSKIAKQLDCYGAVYEDGDGSPGTPRRRPVAEIRLLTKYEGATLQFSRADGFGDITFKATKICNFIVTNENEKSTLNFQVQCEAATLEVQQYMVEQKKEPCAKLLIIGDQLELEFSSPKRGRPKKSKDKKDDQAEAA